MTVFWHLHFAFSSFPVLEFYWALLSLQCQWVQFSAAHFAMLAIRANSGWRVSSSWSSNLMGKLVKQNIQIDFRHFVRQSCHIELFLSVLLRGLFLFSNWVSAVWFLFLHLLIGIPISLHHPSYPTEVPAALRSLGTHCICALAKPHDHSNLRFSCAIAAWLAVPPLVAGPFLVFEVLFHSILIFACVFYSIDGRCNRKVR